MEYMLNVLVLMLALFGPITLQNSAINISTPEDLQTDLSSAPCKNIARVSAARSLFEKMGATTATVSVEKYKSVENLVIRKEGTSAETIVIGAHYDKTPDGCGAVDNWTGIVTLAHLYRSVKDIPLRKTIVFVAFGREEDGMIGSRAMVDAIAKDQVGQYCAMINIDSLGLAPPQVLDNASSKKLTDLAADVAKSMKIPFGHAIVERADSDSSSFVRKKIPALTIHGMSTNWRSILHTGNDQPSKINPLSVYLGYRLILAMIGRLDASVCAAYA